ncbi:unnamed protein product (macronuclear) [Paramecium tetraurelia]|uniref:Uncharacterized protein n=1 Tax=Paramecium tetraurelia TaxID=5888 RepID=A0DUF6_PARTE|nr:uncharacterized protein GSPATT00020345001 [Paramecium tetraurelia]CAK86673.1 unnamed protein product [Paramecium tetraurelia]|eukprot:XP_001454070.1 hypothetical protein (macronuclear) [Paramecium tetraurelia strain d4-2]
MLIIVFISLILVNSSVIRRSETKVDEQGRKYHYSEKYEEEFSYEIQKRCSDDDSEGQLEFENDFKYDEDVEGQGDEKNADGNEELQQQRDEKQPDNEDEYYKEDEKEQLKKEKLKHKRQDKEVDEYVLLLQNESLKLHLTAN